MPNTYTQIHIHFIFAVKYRQALIGVDWKERLYQYITGIIQNNNHKMMQINGMPDHIHLFVGIRPYQAISALIQNVKSESTKWINDNSFCKTKFAWQEGFGAFSYSKSQISNVVKYIQEQELHHKKKSFLQEYKDFLNLFDVDWKEEYIFKELE